MKEPIYANHLTPIQEGKLAIFQRREAVFAAYGFAVSSFSAVEQGLLGVSIFIDDKEVREAAQVFWKIGPAGGKFDHIKRLLKKSTISERSDEWSELSARVGNALKKRNDIVHGEVAEIFTSPSSSQVGCFARLPETASTGALNYNADTNSIEGTRFFTQKELMDVGLEFIDLSEALFAFTNKLSAHS